MKRELNIKSRKREEKRRESEKDTSAIKCENTKKRRMGARSVPRGFPVRTKTLLG